MRCNQFCAKKYKTFTILRCIFYIAVFNQIMTKRNIEGGVISEAIFKLGPILKCMKSLFSTFHFSTCAQKCWKAADFKYSKNWEQLFCTFGWGWDQIWIPIEITQPLFLKIQKRSKEILLFFSNRKITWSFNYVFMSELPEKFLHGLIDI